MRYADIKENDIVDGEGVCVSFWVQGCPLRCKNCQNPSTWDFKGGKELSDDYVNTLGILLDKNGIKRNLSILGGEPLCKENLEITYNIVHGLRDQFKDRLFYVWTGYTFEYLLDEINEEVLNRESKYLNFILHDIDYLIDGRYNDDKRDITLYLRGSNNQRVIDMKETFKTEKIVCVQKDGSSGRYE